MRCTAIRCPSGKLWRRGAGALPTRITRAGWLTGGLSAVFLLGVAAAFVPLTANAVSTADETYATALRLKPSLDHGEQLFQLCAACHGPDGTGAPDGSVPAIAGQYVPVLLKQLIDFRSDARQSIRVQGFLSHHQLTAQDLADVAAYVSSLPPRRPPPAREIPQASDGAALFENLCAGCHGSHGEGNPAARVPRLAGQHSEYLAEQLRDAAEGMRRSMELDHSHLLTQLNTDQMNGLAEYLAGISPVRRAPSRFDQPGQ